VDLIEFRQSGAAKWITSIENLFSMFFIDFEINFEQKSWREFLRKFCFSIKNMIENFQSSRNRLSTQKCFLISIIDPRWAGWQVPSRGPHRCGISSNSYQTCRYNSNHCYPCWMCSERTGYAFYKARQRPCCWGWPKTSILQLNTEGLTANKTGISRNS